MIRFQKTVCGVALGAGLVIPFLLDNYTIVHRRGWRSVVRKRFQQPVCNPGHLCNGIVYDPVPFDAGHEADGNVQSSCVLIVPLCAGER